MNSNLLISLMSVIWSAVYPLCMKVISPVHHGNYSWVLPHVARTTDRINNPNTAQDEINHFSAPDHLLTMDLWLVSWGGYKPGLPTNIHQIILTRNHYKHCVCACVDNWPPEQAHEGFL
jgi:hypothetical protein